MHTCLIYKASCTKVLKTQWRIQGGARDAPPLGPILSYFLSVFDNNFGVPPSGIGVPPKEILDPPLQPFLFLSKYPWKWQHSVLKLWLTQLLPPVKNLLAFGGASLMSPWINHPMLNFRGGNFRALAYPMAGPILTFDQELSLKFGTTWKLESKITQPTPLTMNINELW